MHINYLYAASFVSGIFVFAVYAFFARRRWLRIIESSLDYHRFHISGIMNDGGVDAKSKETCRIMLWAINKQLPVDIKNGDVGLRCVWKTMMGGHTALTIVWEIFFKIVQDRYGIDTDVEKLSSTLLSTVYRLQMLRSVAAPVFTVFMDTGLLLSMIRKPAGGSSALFLFLATREGRAA